MNKPNFFIKYQSQQNSEINLALLGESIIGFDKTIREIYNLSKIEGDLEIKATKISHGSILIEIILSLGTYIPFHNTNDLLEFYRIVSPELFKQASSFFSDFKNIHKTVNDFISNHPFDCFLFGYFVSKLIEYAKRQKNQITLTDVKGIDLPERYYAEGLNKIINKKRGFKRALIPFIEDEVTSIKISTEKKFKEYIEINSKNFEHYLPEDEKFLPELENGKTYSFTGKLVALQSNKGESLKIKVQKILLVAYPKENKTAQDYIQYFNKDISFNAEVIRKSLYQKPKLKILVISLHHQQLELF